MTTHLIRANIDAKALDTTERRAVECVFEDEGIIADRDDDQPDEDDGRGTSSVCPADPAGDQVMGLREWGTRRMLPLRIPSQPSLPAAESTTALQLSRGTPSVVAGRLEVVYERRSWRVKDWDAVDELKQDGTPAREVSLLPGMEVSIAGHLFVAESARTIALRNFCSRLLGWGDDQLSAVDHAPRAIRLAASGRAVLMLRGGGDLIHVAQTIHRYAAREAAPFIVSDSRRHEVAATVRNPANYRRGIDALRRARHGTLCIRLRSPPPDFDEVLRAVREPECEVQLVVCATAAPAREVLAVAAAHIQIPSLKARPAEEVERIVSEYIEDAIETLGAPRDCLGPRDIEWILERGAVASDLAIPDIEKAVFRLVAIKMTSTLTEAADMLGMASVSVARWLARRSGDLPARARRNPALDAAIMARRGGLSRPERSGP
jgi:hypothetical protein